ncbi:hypothetical protein BC831DRAFT_15685 [Entophlyctis helioformis]|nr:hypothetical protein BC831DRAFT_15685 [Entophlyctis helioformis]
MFYRCDDGREPGDGLLGLLADAAAILGQARDFGKDELEYIAKCAADFGHFLETVDEAVAQAEANPHADAHVGIMFPNLGEQMGILAVIELLALANEHQRDAYLPICLKALEFLSHVDLIYEEDEDDDGGMLRELDAFTCEVCTRLFRLAALSPSWQDRLLDTVWLWCKNLQGQITGHSKPFAIHAAVAALIGIYRSFKSQHAAIISRNAKGLRDLFEDTLSEEKLRIVAQTSTAIHSDEDIPSVPIEGYTALNWITALVEGVRDVLAASLRLEDYSSTCFREIWQDLAKTRAQSRIVTESTMPTQDALAGIYYACWHPDWRHTLVRHLSVDADALSDVYTSLVHVAVLCSLHVPSLQRNLLQNLNAILDDTTVVIESTTLDVYLATIEGLAIVSTNSETAAASSSKALMTFLTQPATVFINAEGDACAILRECTCRSLSNILALASESNNRKTALYTFANTLHSTHNKIITATTAKTDAGRRYQNAVAAIASLCSVLKAKETIEVAIPALARRLDDSQTIFDDFIWKNLGNIGLTNDTDVFRNIITFILDYSKRTFSKISKISHTLARMPGRPVELLELYLEKLLALFAEKATTLLRNPADTNVIAELRDIMSIVKVVCEQEHFHPQSLAATYTELTVAVSAQGHCVQDAAASSGSQASVARG